MRKDQGGVVPEDVAGLVVEFLTAVSKGPGRGSEARRSM